MQPSFNTCPLQPASTIVPIGGGALPSNACTDKCALFLRSADPRTGKPVPGGACSFAVLAANVAQIGSMLQVVPRQVPESAPLPEPTKPA